MNNRINLNPTKEGNMLSGIPLLDGACLAVREADGAGCARPKGHPEDAGHYYAIHAGYTEGALRGDDMSASRSIVPPPPSGEGRNQ